MLKTLGAQIKEFKRASIATPIFMILEVVMETIIPLLMASIIDKGVEAGNIGHIYRTGALMVVMAAMGLLCGCSGRKVRCKSIGGICQRTFVRPCLTTFRLFHFPTLTSSAPQVL